MALNKILYTVLQCNSSHLHLFLLSICFVTIEPEAYSMNMSMDECKKDATPLLMHWSYVFLALTHSCDFPFYCNQQVAVNGVHFGALPWLLKLKPAIKMSVIHFTLYAI